MSNQTNNPVAESEVVAGRKFERFSGDSIGFHEAILLLWKNKLIISAVIAIFVAVSASVTFSLPNVYKSDILLAPVSEQEGLRVPGQLGGLAALAGVNIGAAGEDKAVIAMEILKSRDFIGAFIEKNQLLIPVMAAKGWDSKTGQLVIDDDIYDSAKGVWVRSVASLKHSTPSLIEAHSEFLKRNLSVSQNKKTGLVTISVSHFSPILAAQWARSLVDEINSELRSRELLEAEKSIEYLNRQIQETNIAEMKSMLFSLIEEQTKKAMIANVKDEYIFKIIDSAAVAEDEYQPNRILIIFMSALVGFVFVSAAIFLRNSWQK